MEQSPNNNGKKLTIRRIPLVAFLKLLNNVYQSGADWIDINGIINDEARQDEITISVPMSYMNEEHKPPDGGSEDDTDYDDNEYEYEEDDFQGEMFGENIKEEEIITREIMLKLINNA